MTHCSGAPPPPPTYPIHAIDRSTPQVRKCRACRNSSNATRLLSEGMLTCTMLMTSSTLIQFNSKGWSPSCLAPTQCLKPLGMLRQLGTTTLQGLGSTSDSIDGSSRLTALMTHPLEDTAWVHQPPFGGPAHPISDLSVRLASYPCHFMLTCAHSMTNRNDRYMDLQFDFTGVRFWTYKVFPSSFSSSISFF